MAFAHRGDAFDGCGRGGGGRDVWNSVLDGGFADVGVVVAAHFAAGRIDDELDFVVHDAVDDVGPAFMHLQDGMGRDAAGEQKMIGFLRGQDAEPQFVELPRDALDGAFVLVLHGNQDGPAFRQDLLRRFLRLVIGQTEGIGHTQHFAGRTHLRPEDGIDFREHIEGEDGFLDAEMMEGFTFQIEVRDLLSQHDLGGNPGHGNVADLGNQRNGARCARIGFQDIDHIVGDGILHIHQADDIQFVGDLARILVNGLDVPGGND